MTVAENFADTFAEIFAKSKQMHARTQDCSDEFTTMPRYCCAVEICYFDFLVL